MAAKGKRPYGSGGLRIVSRAAGDVWVGSWRPAPGARVTERTLGPVRRRGQADGLTKAMAEERLRQLMAELAAAPARASAGRVDLDVAEVARRYLLHKQAMGRKATTLRHIESAMRLWIVPTLGDRPVERLTEQDFDALAASLVSAGRSPKYVRNVCGEFASMMKWALRQRYATTSPADLSRLPQARKSKRLRFLTVDEVDLVLAHRRTSPLFF